MKKINWILRLKNKATLTTLLVAIIAFVYQVLGLFEIVPSISQDSITSTVLMIVNLLTMLGIVVDPTTSGITDSKQALTYSSPKVDE